MGNTFEQAGRPIPALSALRANGQHFGTGREAHSRAFKPLVRVRKIFLKKDLQRSKIFVCSQK